MFGRFIKKFKKIHLYFRVGIVYLLFLFIKWAVFRLTGVEVGIEGLVSKTTLDAYGNPLPRGWVNRKNQIPGPARQAGRSMYENIYTSRYDEPDPLISWIPKKKAEKITDFSEDLYRDGQKTLMQPHGSIQHFRKADEADHIPKLPGKYPIREHIWGTQVLPLPPQGPEEASPIFIPPSVRMLNLEELRAAALEEDRRRSGQRKLRGKPGIGDKGAALLAKLNVMPKPPPSTVIWNKGYIGRNHNRPELFNN